jgi:hypothetical protein
MKVKKYIANSRGGYCFVHFQTSLPCSHNIWNALSQGEKDYITLLWSDWKFEEMNKVLARYPIPNLCKAEVTLMSGFSAPRKPVSWRLIQKHLYGIRVEFNRYIPQQYEGFSLPLHNPESFLRRINLEKRLLTADIISYMSFFYGKQLETTKG